MVNLPKRLLFLSVVFIDNSPYCIHIPTVSKIVIWAMYGTEIFHTCAILHVAYSGGVMHLKYPKSTLGVKLRTPVYELTTAGVRCGGALVRRVSLVSCYMHVYYIYVDHVC